MNIWDVPSRYGIYSHSIHSYLESLKVSKYSCVKYNISKIIEDKERHQILYQEINYTQASNSYDK